MTHDKTRTAHMQPSLNGIDFLSAIPPDELRKLAKRCTWHRLRPYELLIDGDVASPHGVFLLTEGVVELSRRDGKGTSISIGRVNAPAYLGEFAAIMDSPGATSIRTITTCMFAELSGQEFIMLLKSYPALSFGLLKKTISIVRAFDHDIVQLHLADKLLAAAHHKALLHSL